MAKEIEDKYAVGGIGIVADGNCVDPIAYVESNDEELAGQMMSHMDGHMEDINSNFNGKDNGTPNGGSKSFGMSGSWRGSSWTPQGPRKNWIDPNKKLN